MSRPETPLNIYDALHLLQQKWHELDGYDRHDLAVEATKEAAAVGAVVPEHIFRYSGETLSPLFGDHMRVRAQYTADPEISGAYGRLSKVAAALPLDELVKTVYELDALAGLQYRYGTRLSDPHLCVFDRVKEAAWSWNHGGHYVTEQMLLSFAASSTRGQLHALFDDDFIVKFRKDPVGFFKAQSVDVQTILARMVSQPGTQDVPGVGFPG